MLIKPSTGDRTLNRFTGAKIDVAAMTVEVTGDCKCSPDPATIAIAKPWIGAFGPERDKNLQAGQFVIVGADKAEFKFTLS